MKKVLLTLLGIIVVVGVLAGAGFTGYRIGYMQGNIATGKGVPQLPLSGKNFDPQKTPFHNFGNNMERGFNFNHGPGHFGFGMMQRGMPRGGFGFLSPLFFLGRVAIWAVIIWLIYLAIKKSGWTLTRQTAVNPVAKEEVAPAPEEKAS